MFNDLATVANKEENGRLLSVLPGRGNFAWIGLHGDLNQWVWMLENAKFNNDTHFSNWGQNDLDNKVCTVMTVDGFWQDSNCWKEWPAVCYYGKKDPASLSKLLQ